MTKQEEEWSKEHKENLRNRKFSVEQAVLLQTNRLTVDTEQMLRDAEQIFIYISDG